MVKVYFTVKLACSRMSCVSYSAELDNQSLLSLLCLVYDFSLAKLSLLAHLNGGNSKFIKYKELRLKIRPVSI